MNPILRAFLNRKLGREGELAASAYLRRKGIRILARNFLCRSGEIDLIARDGDTLVFVEVKTRREGVPAEAVTPAKERSLTLAAMTFLRRYEALEVRSRFDIIAIVWPDSSKKPNIEHIVNAFEAVGRGQMFR
jgi:putative endonuclease